MEMQQPSESSYKFETGGYPDTKEKVYGLRDEYQQAYRNIDAALGIKADADNLPEAVAALKRIEDEGDVTRVHQVFIASIEGMLLVELAIDSLERDVEVNKSDRKFASSLIQ